MKCNLCPRNCNIDRTKTIGFCSSNQNIKIAKYMLHYWEEPIICKDNKPSGAIFFSGCNLKCVYCQNYEISSSNCGKEYSIQDLANLFKTLEEQGASNIDLVTPTHFQNEIVEALKIYKPNIPVVWNSSGYEKAEEIAKLKDYIDVFLVDLKYMDSDIALKYSKAKDYPEVVTKAILQMRKNIPNDKIVYSQMLKGLLIRHLVLPNNIDNSFNCLNWIKENLSVTQYISIMSQFTPCYKAKDYPKINRKLKPIEYKRVLAHAEKLGFINGFYQSLNSADTNFIPDFKN